MSAQNSILMAVQGRDWFLLHLLGGPGLFLLTVALPVPSMTYAVHCSLGLLFWMAWWWLARPVHLAVTGFLPLAVVALFNFLPAGRVLPAYAEELIFLLLGANVLTIVWGRWGLDRRIALVSLIGVGTGARRQIAVWFGLSLGLSAFLPNTIVAATLIPVVVAMLRFIGIEDLWNSRFGTAVLLAIAWGTGVGGFATPLGGAPNLLTIRFVEESIVGREFLFVTWLARMAPMSIVLAVVASIFMVSGFRPEVLRIQGTRPYFLDELRRLGRMSVPEKWGLSFFVVAAMLAFARPLYADALPGFSPAYAFLTFGLLCFMIRHDGKRLLDWEYAQGRIMWGLFYLFAGGTALGRVLSETGTAKYLADLLTPYASGGGFVAVLIFGALAMIVTQITSNTAAVAITMPVTIGTFQNLGMNPVPYVYIVSAIACCGYMLPSSSGGTMVAAGYGVNLRTMFVKGFWISLLSFGVLLGAGYLLVVLWPGFSIA